MSPQHTGPRASTVSPSLLGNRLFLIFLLGSSIFPDSSLAGVLAYYSFDSDFTDGVGSNDLTTGAGAPSITTAESEVRMGGGALSLNGSSDLDFTNNISFGASDEWSVSFWGKRASDADVRSGMVLGTTSGFIWTPDNSSVVQGMRLRINGDNDFGGIADDAQYHHWVVVANGSGFTVYRDNVLLGTQASTTSVTFDEVGTGANSPNIYDGSIDELYIYDEAIDATTIDDLFNSGGGTSNPDTTPPTLAGSDIVDDANGGPVAVNAGVNYTFTFSENIDATTVDSSDFGNAGTSIVTFGSITATSPGVFNVIVTPADIGSLQLSVLEGATLADAAGNALDTSSAILDDTILTVETTVVPPTIRKIHVFLLGGQSNADGRANSSLLPTSPVNLQQAQEDVDFHTGGSLSNLAPGSQFGPEITMGRRLADSLGSEAGTRVALIKYGVGGTSLEVDWAPGGDGTTAGDGARYVTFQNQVTNGMAALTAAYPEATIEIKGMLWVQGERDAKGGYEDLYETNLTDFIADVRATYAAELPFIISQLSINQTNIPSAPLGVVRAAQTTVAEADGFSRLLDTDPFGLQGDKLHFNASGQQDIGHGAAFALLHFFPVTTPPRIASTTDGNFELSLEHAFPDFTYTLESNPDLSAGNWSVESSQTAEASTILFPITPAAGQTSGFYRIKRTLPGN